MSAATVSADREHVFRVPLIDPETPPSSTGGYPWRADGTTATVVYLKNTTGAPQTYLLQLSFAGGAYAPGLKTLQAGETVSIDIQALRDAQTPDALGRTIQREAMGGQVHWTAKGPMRNVSIGRAEHADHAHGVSASYACLNCCQDNPYESWTIDSPIVVAPGDWVDVFAYMRDQDCFGNPREPYSLGGWNGLNYSTANSGIAYGSDNATVTGVSPGSTTFSLTYNTQWWYPDVYEGGWFCNSDNVAVHFQAPVEVTCAQPVNFRQTFGAAGTNGSLGFEYRWDSSTGNLAHLSSCQVGERVDYFSTWPFPSPPFRDSPPQPTEINFPASDGVLSDIHTTGQPFLHPYSQVSTIGSQIYRHNCRCDIGAPEWTTLHTPFGGIVRSFEPNGIGGWKFTASKAGVSSVINPLPQ